MKKELTKKYAVAFAIAFAIVSVLSIALLPNNTAVVYAEEAAWTSTGDGWHYLVGTDVKVKIEKNTVHVYGTGAIPDFDYYKLYERPWSKTKVEVVFIEPTITSIGRYAFYDLQDLQHISIYKSTYIKDATCFDKIAYKPIFRIYEAPIATEMIGTIPYTSLDSIVTIAQTNYNGASYILDTKGMATDFQNRTNPTVSNVYYADEKIPKDSEGKGGDYSPWQWIEVWGNGNVATPICKFSPLTPNHAYSLAAQRRYPGRACYEAYAAFIGDYTFAAPFNVSLTSLQKAYRSSYEYVTTKKVEETDVEYMYVLTIPEEFRQPLRSFRLLGIGKGTVNIYDDLDADDSTITFATKTPSTAYALVYK